MADSVTILGSSVAADVNIVGGTLPSGTNNIGDVDIASAIPVGANSIGTVGLDAGSKSIGDVGVQPSQRITIERTIAGSRTNEMKYSEDMSNPTGWGIWEVTRTANDVLGPFGDITAEKIVSNAVDDAHAIFNEPASSFTVTAGQPFCISMFVKDDTSGWVGLDIGDPTTTDAGTVYFDIANGKVGNTIVPAGSKLYVVDSDIEQAANGYWRCWIVFNSDAGVLTSMDMSAVIPNGNQTLSGWTATHTVSGLGFWVTGAQIEDNVTYPGPYIKNLAGSLVTAGSNSIGTVGVEDDFLHVALMSAQAATNDGVWQDVRQYKDASIHMENFSDGTAEVRGSSALTIPANNVHATIIGSAVTGDKHLSITNLPAWVKVRKTVAGSDTPSAFLVARK